jgi:hypothetical protein
MKTTGDSERQVWAAMLLATGQTDVFGAVRRSPRLHWSFDGARLEAEGWAEEMSAGPIAWARIENGIAVGRIKGHAVVLRSILLPLGKPPGEGHAAVAALPRPVARDCLLLLSA